ncbi:competence/damage-inducible protein A [Parapusillimonas granuli]|uniref:Competence/damage-inducible protein A n=1 Tax=Parapusillimonas granuli TaxID=380911 RepID=A0A853G0G8_9BURK|nr:molybdopterin-binding protein [Parapusillimonas granuli]MBB5215063.1 molybdopterin-biosynthesis enzyme MoeA-like protein [Parapusillimonas granuli]NYT49382.1 competence/damage-inducible protein A [Parapusillimonas granuli]
MSTTPPKIRLIIIGDEILSGRRQDKHFAKLVELLSQRGLQLGGAEFISDERAVIADTLRRSFRTGDIVFCCGGIGATPDDQTRQAAAEALGVELALHPEAARLIAERCADNERRGQGSGDMSLPENQQRLQMGVFPVGAEIVPNPYNKIPGFFIQDHTFMPGFPVMAWPMMEWTLDARYSQLHHKQRRVEHSFLVFKLPESRITPALEELERRWPGIKAFSLPSMGETGHPHIDLGVKGEPEAAALALEFLRGEAIRMGGELNPPQK